MSDKILDVFYKKKGQKKVKYVGAGWEGKYAEQQREEGKEPWIDLNLSIMDGETRVYATEIKFGNKVLKLGKESGIFLKLGLCKGFTVAELDSDDFEEAEEEEEPEEADEEADEEEEDDEEEAPKKPARKAKAKRTTTPRPAKRTRKAKAEKPPVDDDEDDDTDLDDL